MSAMDAINGFFEATAAWFVWGNVAELLKAKCVAGVRLRVTAWYVLWGISSLVYYWRLGHWYSFAGNCAIVAANVTWLALATYYRRRPRG